MSITPDDIADAMTDIEEDELETGLCEADCFHTNLANAIVRLTVIGADLDEEEFYESLTSLRPYLLDCAETVRKEMDSAARRIAQEKYDARRFSAPMADDDDYYLRMTA